MKNSTREARAWLRRGPHAFRAMVVLTAAIGALVAVLPATASAQGEIDIAKVFTWYTATPSDWNRGLLYAVLGFVGALTTLFGLIGGAVPGTAGKAHIDKEQDRLDRMSNELEGQVKTADAAKLGETRAVVAELRNWLTKERWRQFSIAALFYTVLGAFFAMMFAQDLIQAVLIGAGWTGILGTLGLKQDYANRKSEKDAVLDAARESVQALRSAAGQRDAVAAPERLEQADGLIAKIQMARAL